MNVNVISYSYIGSISSKYQSLMHACSLSCMVTVLICKPLLIAPRNDEGNANQPVKNPFTAWRKVLFNGSIGKANLWLTSALLFLTKRAFNPSHVNSCLRFRSAADGRHSKDGWRVLARHRWGRRRWKCWGGSGFTGTRPRLQLLLKSICAQVCVLLQEGKECAEVL